MSMISDLINVLTSAGKPGAKATAQVRQAAGSDFAGCLDAATGADPGLLAGLLSPDGGAKGGSQDPLSDESLLAGLVATAGETATATGASANVAGAAPSGQPVVAPTIIVNQVTADEAASAKPEPGAASVQGIALASGLPAMMAAGSPASKGEGKAGAQPTIVRPVLAKTVEKVIEAAVGVPASEESALAVAVATTTPVPVAVKGGAEQGIVRTLKNLATKAGRTGDAAPTPTAGAPVAPLAAELPATAVAPALSTAPDKRTGGGLSDDTSAPVAMAYDQMTDSTTPTSPVLATSVTSTGPVSGPVNGAMMPLADTGAVLSGQVIDMAIDGQWIDRVAREITQLAEGTGHSRFQLNPPQLGRLQIDIWQGDAGSAVRMLTETDDAAKRLNAGRETLEADARLSALSLTNVVIERAPSAFGAQTDANSQNGHPRHQPSGDVANQGNSQTSGQGGNATGQQAGGSTNGQDKAPGRRDVFSGKAPSDRPDVKQDDRRDDPRVRYA